MWECRQTQEGSDPVLWREALCEQLAHLSRLYCLALSCRQDDRLQGQAEVTAEALMFSPSLPDRDKAGSASREQKSLLLCYLLFSIFLLR